MANQVITNVIQGALKLVGLPDRARFTDMQSFVRYLEKAFVVEVPLDISGVVFGDQSPAEDARDKIWVNRRSNGEITGVLLFNLGKWRPWYALAPGQYVWVAGDSQNYDPDFTVILTGDSVIPPNVVTDLMNSYVSDGLGGYSKFAVRYSPT